MLIPLSGKAPLFPIHGTVRFKPSSPQDPHRSGLRSGFIRALLIYLSSKENVAAAMNFLLLLLTEILSFVVCSTQNLSCYQCIKNSNEECGPEHLLPCPKVADRCVTHISKHVDKGYLIKRECGLGPCDFGDDMANKGLGMDGCDRSKEEYFCVFCCRTDGCNKNGSSITISSLNHLLIILILSLNFYCRIF